MSEYSPLKFARDFEKLRADLHSEPDPADGLALTLDFGKSNRDQLLLKSNWTYLAEFTGELTKRCTKDNLENLSFDELQAFCALLETFSERNLDNIKDTFDAVRREYARKLFFIGDYDNALKNLGADTAIGSTDKDLIKGLNEFDTLYHIYALYKDIESPIKSELLDILTEWQGYRESLYQDQALCLFVEKDHRGTVSRGRMKFLSARVELFRKSAPIDEVTFDNQIKTPDDPFVGVAYDALEAVRGVFNRGDFRHKAVRRYHAHFNIAGGNHQFTGDSIGLAAALLTYTQLMKPEIMRHERFLSSDVAFTGSIDNESHILPVNCDTIALKVERAFFSPVKYLVVPEDNLATAQSALEKLNVQYPNRRLLLVGASHLSDLLENRNIIRSEKVCIGQLTARRVVKYSRMTKLQVPLLLVLIWALLAIIDTKTFAPWWFDWRIDHIEIMGNRFRTVNPDGKEIWVSEEFEAELIADAYTKNPTDGIRFYLIYDLDNDRKDELFFVPKYNIKGSVHSSKVHLYDSKGRLKWAERAFRPTTYPGDTNLLGRDVRISYANAGLESVIGAAGRFYLMTFSDCSSPMRLQITLLDTSGAIVSGPYIHTGAPYYNSPVRRYDIDGDKREELFICCTNNRYNRASLLIIDPFRLDGVSPPYDDDLFVASGMPRGSQLYYLAVPESPLSDGYNVRNYVTNIKELSANGYELLVTEGINLSHHGDIITRGQAQKLPAFTYVLDKNFIPRRIYMPDGSDHLLNYYLKQLEKDTIADFTKLFDSLIDETIVYYGDSIVHHLSGGINFYKK